MKFDKNRLRGYNYQEYIFIPFSYPMENKRILETAGTELEKRVSAVSNLQQTLEGVRSNLLDILLEDQNPKNREEIGNPIKEELEKKLQIAKAHKPPRIIYIENLEKVMGDLEKRIAGEETDDNRKYLLDLNKRDSYNKKIIEQLVEEVFESAKSTNKIENELVYQKITSKKEYREDVIRFLEHRKDELTDSKQKKNINAIIKKLKSQVDENKKEEEQKLKNKLYKE